jgi:hypothetical protein
MGSMSSFNFRITQIYIVVSKLYNYFEKKILFEPIKIIYAGTVLAICPRVAADSFI